MKSRLLTLYKFTADFSAHCMDKVPMSIGLPKKEFEEIVIELHAFGSHLFNHSQKLSEIEKVDLNTPSGPLRIYKNEFKTV